MSQNELLNLFDPMFEDSMFSTMNVPDIMRTDSYEYGGNLILEIELPGYEQKDVHAELKGGYLTIMANRPSNLEEEYKKREYSIRERHIGGCMRKYYVGYEIRQENVKAAFKDGILRVLIQLPSDRITDERKYIEIK